MNEVILFFNINTVHGAKLRRHKRVSSEKSLPSYSCLTAIYFLSLQMTIVYIFFCILENIFFVYIQISVYFLKTRNDVFYIPFLFSFMFLRYNCQIKLYAFKILTEVTALFGVLTPSLYQQVTRRSLGKLTFQLNFSFFIC